MTRNKVFSWVHSVLQLGLHPRITCYLNLFEHRFTWRVRMRSNGYFLNWAMAQGMIRSSLKNSLGRSWETVMWPLLQQLIATYVTVNNDNILLIYTVFTVIEYKKRSVVVKVVSSRFSIRAWATAHVRLILNSVSQCYLAKRTTIFPTNNFSLFYDPPRLVHSCRAKPMKKVGPKRRLTGRPIQNKSDGALRRQQIYP